ncbi:MAG: histidine kinase [Clostridia bacterium]|nr:histidine kinase [Clostridia bacterium]
MAEHEFHGKSCIGPRLLFFLLSFLIAFSSCCAAGNGEDGVVGLNASGVRNEGLSVNPVRDSEGFSAVLYDNRSGLPASGVNAIAQTRDGFLWIGSYAGLIYYDGKIFQQVDPEKGITNVRCLYVDSRGRLWIGTNDSGVFCMDFGKLNRWGKESGMDSASIRVIAEGADGIIYLGTTSGICAMYPDMTLSILQDVRVSSRSIQELRLGPDGLVYGLTSDGELFSMENGEVVSYIYRSLCPVKGILSILPDPAHPDKLFLGTEGSQVYYGSFAEGFASVKTMDIAPLSYVERFEYIDGQLWICAGNGIGVLDGEDFRQLPNCPMNNSVGHVMTDYEGNLWFTSSRQGIMKIVPNQFTDLFFRYDLPSAFVNSTCLYEDQLFIGTETGLIVIKDGHRAESLPLKEAMTASGVVLEPADLIKLLDGIRVLSIVRDSQDRLWISTWGRTGLICYDGEKVTSFTRQDGMFSSQVRMVTECRDGTILAANTGGVSAIRDGRVDTSESYGEESGIPIPEVLAVAEGFHGEVLVGTDGAGLYVIGPEGTRQITSEDGLNSDVILRIKRIRDQQVLWIITSNSLCYMTPDYRVTAVDRFHFTHIYDLYENSKGEAWILASGGIYVVPMEKLLKNEPTDAVLLGINNGLPYGITANSSSELTPEGDLYIAGSIGAVKVNIEEPLRAVSVMKAALPYIDADGKRYYSEGNGYFHVPGSVQKVTVYPYVFRFSLVDPLVSYHLEGFETTETVLRSSEFDDPVVYTNLPAGDYLFIIRVDDPMGDRSMSVSFRIVKGNANSIATVGSIIMDAASLFLLTGLLFYTVLYRKRGHADDKMFFALIIINMVLAASDMLTYIVDGLGYAGSRRIMNVGNLIFFTAFEAFPCLFFFYLHYRANRDMVRLKKIIPWALIPYAFAMLLLQVNLMTGWIYNVDINGVYQSGPWNGLVFIPAVFYLMISLFQVRRISVLLVFLGIMLAAVRLIWGIWFRDISSTALTYTLFLVCTHVHVMNQPLLEEKI